MSFVSSGHMIVVSAGYMSFVSPGHMSFVSPGHMSLGDIYIFLHLPSNGVIAKIALCDLDLLIKC